MIEVDPGRRAPGATRRDNEFSVIREVELKRLSVLHNLTKVDGQTNL